jgi:hypothetical protein
MKGVRELFLLVSCCIHVSLGYVGNYLPSSRLATSLHMGLGSFVRKRFRGNDGEEKGGDEPQKGNPLPKPTIVEKPQPPPPVRQQVSRDDFPPPRHPPPRNPVPAPPSTPGVETNQERINRVKKGKMTDEEKKRFLDSTLKGGPSSNNSPVRQPLAQESASVNNRQRSSATPFPKDSMLREVVTGRKDQNSLDEWTTSNKKKKEYFEMVTNPNRFNTFNGQGAPAAPEASQPMPPAVSAENEEIPDLSALPPPPAPSLPPTFDPTDADHLGARLEKAAMAEEARQKEARRFVELQREEERLRQAVQKREREDEMAIQEAEAFRRKEEQMAMVLEQDARRAEEERRRQEKMTQAQDDFWAKKLGLERQRKLEKLGQNDQQERMVEEDRQQEEARFEEELAADQEPVQQVVPEVSVSSTCSSLTVLF